MGEKVKRRQRHLKTYSGKSVRNKGVESVLSFKREEFSRQRSSRFSCAGLYLSFCVCVRDVQWPTRQGSLNGLGSWLGGMI